MRSKTDSYASEGASGHILKQREVGRKGFIAIVCQSKHLQIQSYSLSCRVWERVDMLIIFNWLGIRLGHLGHSGRCSAVGLDLKIQIGDVGGVAECWMRREADRGKLLLGLLAA